MNIFQSVNNDILTSIFSASFFFKRKFGLNNQNKVLIVVLWNNVVDASKSVDGFDWWIKKNGKRSKLQHPARRKKKPLRLFGKTILTFMYKLTRDVQTNFTFVHILCHPMLFSFFFALYPYRLTLISSPFACSPPFPSSRSSR